jgi:hypothetical protein
MLLDGILLVSFGKEFLNFYLDDGPFLLFYFYVQVFLVLLLII